jgi:hypothetical protein
MALTTCRRQTDDSSDCRPSLLSTAKHQSVGLGKSESGQKLDGHSWRAAVRTCGSAVKGLVEVERAAAMASGGRSTSPRSR